MTADIVITSKITDIENEVEAEVIREIFAKILVQAKSAVEQQVVPLVVKAVQDTETWSAIQGFFAGDPQRDLQAALGVEDPSPALNEILGIIRTNLRVNILPDNSGYVIDILSDESYRRMVSSNLGAYVSEPSGDTIPWLRWLLLGSSDSVIGYSLAYEGSNIRSFEKSRTGRAIMRKTKAGTWNIEDHIVGGEQNNFLFEALDNDRLVTQIQGIITRELNRVSN